MAFRSKSPDRVVEEFTALRERTGVTTVSIADDILESHYFQTAIPELARRQLGWNCSGR
jgi:hypothetical protein